MAIRKKKEIDFDSVIEKQIDNADHYKLYKKLYDTLKEQYLERIKDEDFNIAIERLRLECIIGKHVSLVANFSMYYFIAVFSGLFIILIQEIFKLSNYDNAIVKITVCFILMISAVYIITKAADKDRPKDLVATISIQVLDDLEQEIRTADEKEKIIKPNSTMYNGCWWINGSKVPILGNDNKDRGNQRIDIGVWVRFFKEARRLFEK